MNICKDFIRYITNSLVEFSELYIFFRTRRVRAIDSGQAQETICVFIVVTKTWIILYI